MFSRLFFFAAWNTCRKYCILKTAAMICYLAKSEFFLIGPELTECDSPMLCFVIEPPVQSVCESLSPAASCTASLWHSPRPADLCCGCSGWLSGGCLVLLVNSFFFPCFSKDLAANLVHEFLMQDSKVVNCIGNNLYWLSVGSYILLYFITHFSLTA